VTSGCPSSSPPTPIPIAIVGGVVGAIFAVVAITLTLIYVFCYKCPTKSGGGGGGAGLWVYSS